MPLAALGLFGLNANDWTGIVTGIVSVILLYQQNQIFKRQNDIFAAQAGPLAMSKTSQASWIARYWPTAVIVGFMGLTGYDIYARHDGAPPAVLWWFYALLLLVVVIVGLVIGRIATTKAGLAPRSIRVDLVPWQGKGDKMFLTVTNRGTEKRQFQGQCRILARRNDPNTPQLITFDLQWEYGGQSYTLGPGQAGNLLIASSDHSEHRDREWLQLESATGTTKPQRSDWNWGEKPAEYDVEIIILSDGEPYQKKFTVRGGKECAIEMGELRATLLDAPIEKAKEPSKLVIQSANYAAWSGGGQRYDVTKFMRSIIRGDGLVFGPIENHSFVVDGENLVPHDPLVHKPKRLEVTYSYNGEQSKTVQRAEHGRITLPEDSVVDWLGSQLNKVSAERDRFQQENKQLALQREIDVQNAKLRAYPFPVLTVEKVFADGPSTNPTVQLKNKVRIILTNHCDSDVCVWTPVWESPNVHADGDPPGSTIQLATKDWQFDEWGDEKICATVPVGRSFRSYIALLPTVGESIYRRLETRTPLGTLVFPVKIRGKLYDIRVNI
jgi:hypothetical protein